MEKLSFNCIACNEKFEIDSNINALDCPSCQTSLTVEKSNNIVYLKPKSSNPKAPLNTSNAILLEQKVDRLDREWLLKREGFPNADYFDQQDNRGSAGTLSYNLVNLLFLIVGIVFMLFWITSVPVKALKLFGIVGLMVLFWIFLSGTMGGNRYRKEKQVYLEKRKKLMHTIENNKDV